MIQPEGVLSTSQRNKDSKDSFFNFNKHVFHGNTIRDAKYQETFLKKVDFK